MHVINVAANVNTVAKIYGLASQLNGVIWTCGLYGAYMCHFLNIERSTLRLNSDKLVKSSFGGIKSFCCLRRYTGSELIGKTGIFTKFCLRRVLANEVPQKECSWLHANCYYESDSVH